jgi:hypothetical protein
LRRAVYAHGCRETTFARLRAIRLAREAKERLMSLQQTLDAFKANFEAGGPPYHAPSWIHEPMHRATDLIINHLQRLPAPTPASPRHNPGTLKLSSSHSWHTGAYGFIATTLLFSRTSSTSAASFTTASTRISTSLFMASARRSSASRSRSLRNTRSYASSGYLSRS